MRLIHTFKNDREARLFSGFLHRENIENKLEISSVTDWGSEDYGTLSCQLWIIDEDDLDAALKWLAFFLENPHDPRFAVIEAPLPPALPPKPKTKQSPKIQLQRAKNLFKQPPFNKQKSIGTLTVYLILFCTILLFATRATRPPLQIPPPNIPLTPLFSSPIKKELLYDYPAAYQIVDKLVNAYGLGELYHPQKLPPEGRFLLAKMHKTPYWQGFYQKFVDYLKPPGKPIAIQAALFEKIRHGEVWRLITPIFLHADLFHLFLT